MVVTINLLFKGKYLTTYLKSLFGISFNMSSFSNPNVPSTPSPGVSTSVNEVNDSAIHKDSPWWESRNHFLFISFLYSPLSIHRQILFILSPLLTFWFKPLLSFVGLVKKHCKFSILSFVFIKSILYLLARKSSN